MWHIIPEHNALYSHCHENFNSYKQVTVNFHNTAVRTMMYSKDGKPLVPVPSLAPRYEGMVVILYLLCVNM
jgi:hypothetical protein